MVLDITSRCKMGCSHCMNNCTEEGIDISLEMVDNIITFIKRNHLSHRVILVGGGEPTEHPLFFDILDMLYKNLSKNTSGDDVVFILTTNGMFLNREDYRDFIDNFRKYRELRIQMSIVDRLYPIKINQYPMDRLQKLYKSRMMVIREIISMGSYGRAIDNPQPDMNYRVSPFCYNPRSMLTAPGSDFKWLVYKLENELNKYCTINYDMMGQIRISESMTCPIVGSVNDSLSDITDSIKTFKCEKCDHIKNMDPVLRHAIKLS